MSVKPVNKSSTDISEQEWATRVELAALYRLVDHYGMSDITNQTICARVQGEPEHFLLCPRGKMFEEIHASDLVKVDLDGNAIEGPGIWEGGEDWDLAAIAGERWITHGAVNLGKWIFKTRPDQNFFIHAHDEEVQAVSATEGRLQAVSSAKPARFRSRLRPRRPAWARGSDRSIRSASPCFRIRCRHRGTTLTMAPPSGPPCFASSRVPVRTTPPERQRPRQSCR